MRRLILLCFLFAFPALAQFTPVDDHHIWNTLRIEGNIDINAEDELPFSIELHHRLRDNMQNFHQFLIRPMIGQRLNDQTTLWYGVAYIATDVQGEIVEEYRLFQLLTYNTKIKDSVLLVSGTRLEQRFVEHDDLVNHRLRQMIRITFPIWQKNQHRLDLFIANELFLRLNQTQWAGNRGFDQNRFVIGIDFRTHLHHQPVILNGGYMMNTMGNGQNIHGVQVGIRIPLQSKKKKSKSKLK
jgi:hypothetical protein